MPPKLGIMNQGIFYWRYSDRNPEWKVLKKYDTKTGFTCEAKLIKEEERNMDYFEIGDKVKVVKLDCNWSKWAPELSNYIGKTGVIMVNCCDYVGIDFGDETGRWYLCKNWLELVEKSSKYWTGKVICIQAKPYHKFEVGKVYEVKDGRFMGPSCTNQTVIEEQCCCVTGVDNLNERYGYGDPIKFVEFKGFAGEE